jgi:ribonuclease R
MKNRIISLFKKNPSKAFKNKDIAGKLKVNADHEYSAMKAVLHQLVEDNFLTKVGKRYKLNRTISSSRVTGVLKINEAGYGFVLVDNSKVGDIFIASRNLGTAFGGDKVEVSLFAKQKGKNLEGQIINVIERKRKEIVGKLQKSKSFYFVKPDDPQVYRDIYIDGQHLLNARVGDKVIAGNIRWGSPKLNPEGTIVELIGKSGSLKAEIASIAREFDLAFKFPVNVIEETEKKELEISDDEISKRLDYRDKNVFTIDPEDAKDFDDALSIEPLDNGNYLVGIHIADVSFFVKKDSHLDQEAFKRGNSVYLVGSVIPMLPEKLSNIICSLNPDTDRLTYSVIVELSSTAKIIDYQIKKSIINSKRRFTYDEVQDIIVSNKGDFSSEIKQLNNLAQTLRKKRLKQGGIEFFTTEVKFDLEEDGSPKSVKIKEIKDSNMLVEEFMLLANKTCAEHINRKKKGKPMPFIYRIHDLPDKEKINEFAKFVKSLGYSFDLNSGSSSKNFQKLISQSKGKEEEILINGLAIRSMAKAVYSPDNIGHYGLGFKFYTHFTSPIRRYSDLIVHRLLNYYIENGTNTLYTYKSLSSISEHITDTERNAVEAERYSVKMKQVEYLQDHIGDEYNAIISGITHFGIFVEIADILAEGLIRVRDLEGDFYTYDEKNYSLIGRRTRKKFRLGDKIKVRLVRTDQEKMELDFILI